MTHDDTEKYIIKQWSTRKRKLQSYVTNKMESEPTPNVTCANTSFSF